MYAVVFSIYTIDLFFKLGLLNWLPFSIHLLEKTVAVLVALLFIAINYRGASETGKIGAIMTFGQTAFLVLIGAIGVVAVIIDPSRLKNFSDFLPMGWEKLLVTMGFTYVAFEGFEVIAQAGDEAINPRQSLPKAMLYSVFIAGITYVLVAFAAIVAVKAGSPGIDTEPWRWIGSFGETGFGAAIERLIPVKYLGNFLLTLAVVFASTSALNATIYSATRASYALGKGRMLPKIFSLISKKRKTPYGALILTSVILIIVAAFLPTSDVASSASIMFLFLFLVVNICVIKIRYNMGDELQYGFVMPLFPVLPVIAIICQIFLAYHLKDFSRIAWIIAPSWICLGLVIYFLYARKRALPSEDEIMVLEELLAENLTGQRVMISVANPDNALNLVDSAFRICRKEESSIKLLHMVPVNDLISLRDGQEYIESGQESIMEAMLYLQPMFPISTTIRYCRNIARGIISAVKERKINTLILGWHGKKKSHLFRIGSTLDQIINRAPCDIVIIKGKAERKLKKILVLLNGDYNDLLCLETALKFADFDTEEIHILTLNRISKQVSDKIKKTREEFVSSGTEITESEYTGEAALNRIADSCGLVCLGSSDQKILISGIAEITEKLAQKDNVPLVIVKRPDKIRSLARKLI